MPHSCTHLCFHFEHSWFSGALRGPVFRAPSIGPSFCTLFLLTVSNTFLDEGCRAVLRMGGGARWALKTKASWSLFPAHYGFSLTP